MCFFVGRLGKWSGDKCDYHAVRNKHCCLVPIMETKRAE